jgi:hypothetical protein
VARSPDCRQCGAGEARSRRGGAAAQQLYRMASSHGLGRRYWASVYQFLKPSSGEAPV